MNGGRLSWLGPRDQRVTAQGVELQASDGTTLFVRFDGGAAPAQAVKVTAAQRLAGAAQAETCQPCTYTDDEGTFHLAQNLDDIPAKYRERAGAVKRKVNIADAAPRPAPGWNQPRSAVSAPLSAADQYAADAAARREREAREALHAAEQKKLDDAAAQKAGRNGAVDSDGTFYPCTLPQSNRLCRSPTRR